MSDSADISFVIPAYQAEKTIKRCLLSILKIHSFDYEIIVVNDGSTDNTAEIVASIASEHQSVFLINQENGGRSVARNCGIEHSRGTWLMFIDADDYLLDSADAVIGQHICSGSDIILFAKEKPLVSQPANVLKFDDFINRILDPADLSDSGLSSEEFNSYWFGTPYMRLFRRFFNASNSPKFQEGLRFGEDAIFNIEYAMKTRTDVELDPNPIYFVDDSTPGTIRSFSATDVDAVARFSDCAKRIFTGKISDNKLDCFIGCEWHRLLWRAARYGRVSDVVVYLENNDVTKEMANARFYFFKERYFCNQFNCINRSFRSTRLAAYAVKCSVMLVDKLKSVKSYIQF